MGGPGDLEPRSVGLDDVLITEELARRPSRPPDHAAENRTLASLAQAMAASPETVLQQLADAALELCRADSAGISLLEPGGAHGLFRWHATAGEFARNPGGTMPREASPCGAVMHRDTVLLFDRAERHFPALRGVEPPTHEHLMAPFHAGGKPVGTVWVISHAPGPRFDAEDARLLVSLSRFASAAYQTAAALRAEREARGCLERRVGEQASEAAAARAFAESIVDTVRDPLLVLDKDLRVVSANRSFYATFKVEPAETERRAVYDLGDGQWDIPRLRTLLEEIVPTNDWFDDFEVEHDFERIGRKSMLLNARRFPPEGPFVLILLAIEDITDRRQAEEKDRRSDTLLAEAQRLARIGSWNWDLTNGAFDWSDEHYRIFGFEPRDPPITLERAWDRVHPEDRARVQDLFDRAMRDRRPYECTFRLLFDDGAVRIVMSRGRPAVDEGGKLVRMFGTLQDITEQMRSEEAVRVANEQLDLAIRGSNLGVWDLDLAPGSDYRRDPVRFINVWEQLGYDPAEFPTDASASRALGHPDDLVRVDGAVVACLAGETEEIRVENRIRHKDGSYHWLLTLGKAMRDASGRPVRLIGTVLDITERKRAEEALRESEVKFRALAENVPSLVWSCTVDRKCDYVNPQFMRYTGQSEAELLGDWQLGNIHADDHAAMFAAWEHSMGTGGPAEFEARVRRNDGVWRWFQIRAAPVRDEQGQIIRWFGTNTDIDDLKRAEEARAALAAIVETSDDAIVSKTLDGIMRSWNAGAERLYGYTAAEAVGQSIDLIIPPGLQEEERSLLERLRRGERSEHFETVRVSKEGRLIPISLTVSPLRDDAGRVVGASKVARDITERKRLEEALRTSEALLAADLASMTRLQELSTRFVQAGDLHSLLREILLAAEEIMGTNKGNIQFVDPGGGELHIIVHHGLGQRFLEHFRSRGSAATCEAALRRGQRVIVEDVTRVPSLEGTTDLEAFLDDNIRAVQSTPLICRDGHVVGMLSNHFPVPHRPTDRDLRLLDLLARMAADHIERSQAEEELRRAKEAAESANRSKDEFLANVSHEIRTPFGAILGMTELVLDTPLTDDQRDCLETAKSAADNLLGLVDDLLDFEKIESGKLELAPADFSLRPMMTDALRTLSVRARAKGLNLRWDVEPGVPDALVGDAGRLRQVLLNLVGNAIKFTKQGEVAVKVEVAEGSAPEGETVLRYLVTDTGIGIPPDGQERIFRAFEQADSSTTRSYGGTGLGLTIATLLVDLMGGEIGVESEPGRGSTFTFTARFGRQSHPAERVFAPPTDVLHEAAPATGVVPLRILVAEDSEFNSRYLERLLGQRGHAVRVATDGREALDLAGEGAFDLLLLDVHMPELDGFQVVRAIRERERAAGGHLPVIALTARARKEDRDHCLAAGMDDYLSKPVRADELFVAIDQVASAHGVSRPIRPDNGDLDKLLDPVVLLETCGEDEVVLRELCRDFRAFAPARIAEVTAAVRDRDATRLREAAHKLCGTLSAFSTAAATAASDLEELAARGQLDEARPLVERLEAMGRELILGLEGRSLEGLRRRGTAPGS